MSSRLNRRARAVAGTLLACARLAAPAVALAPAAAHAAMLLVVNKAESSVMAVDPADGRAIASLAVAAGPHEVAVAPDGGTAVVGSYGTHDAAGNSLAVIDLGALATIRVIDLGGYGRPHGLAFLPDGRHLLVTSETAGSVLVVDLAEGRVVEAIATGGELSHMVVADAAGTRAYVANIRSGTVSVIDLDARAPLSVIETGKGSEGLALAPDGGELWVANRSADTLSIVDTASLTVSATVPCAAFPIRLAFTVDGARVLASNARSGDVAVFDAATRVEVGRIALPLAVAEDVDDRVLRRAFPDSPVPIGLAMSGDGSRAFVAASYADAVAVIDLATLGLAGTIATGREPDGLAWLAGR